MKVLKYLVKVVTNDIKTEINKIFFRFIKFYKFENKIKIERIIFLMTIYIFKKCVIKNSI